MSQENYMQEIWWRLKYDWDIAETLGDRFADFDNNPNIQALRTSPEWNLLVQRQSRFVLLLTEMLLAQGETKLSILDILSRHGDGMGRSIVELVADRARDQDRERQEAGDIGPGSSRHSIPSQQQPGPGPRWTATATGGQGQQVTPNRGFLQTQPSRPSTLPGPFQQLGAGQQSLQNRRRRPTVSGMPGLSSQPLPLPSQFPLPSQQAGPSQFPVPGHQARSALHSSIEPQQQRQPQQLDPYVPGVPPANWNTLGSAEEYEDNVNFRPRTSWSPVLSPQQSESQTQILSSTTQSKYDTLPPSIPPLPTLAPSPLKSIHFRAILPRPSPGVVDPSTTAAVTATATPTPSAMSRLRNTEFPTSPSPSQQIVGGQQQDQQMDIESANQGSGSGSGTRSGTRSGKQPASVTDPKLQHHADPQLEENPPAKGVKRLPRGKK